VPRKPAALTITAAMALAIAAVLLLSTGIDSLSLRPRPVRSEQANAVISGSSTGQSAQHNLVRVLRVVWAVLAVIIVLCLLFWRTFRRLILQYMLGQLVYFTVLFMLAALIFATMSPDEQQTSSPSPLMGTSQRAQRIQDGTGSGDAADTVEVAPATGGIPLWQIGLIALSLTAALLALAAGGVLAIRRFRAPTVPTDRSVLRDIAREAGQALDRLQDGDDPTVVIMECYRRMVVIAVERAGVANLSSNTPREFARQLSGRQMKTDHVRRLTAIFEQVRYGARQAAPYVDEAKACLAAVRDAYTEAAP